MKQTQAVTSLFKDRILLPPESVSNSLLGYMFFREKLLEIILGDNEMDILYWVGKESGNSLEVEQMEEMEDIFLQLDLGHLYLQRQSETLIQYRVTHSRYSLLPKKRLEKTLHFEAGFTAGIIEKLTSAYCVGTVAVHEKDGIISALLEITVDQNKDIMRPS